MYTGDEAIGHTDSRQMDLSSDRQGRNLTLLSNHRFCGVQSLHSPEPLIAEALQRVVLYHKAMSISAGFNNQAYFLQYFEDFFEIFRIASICFELLLAQTRRVTTTREKVEALKNTMLAIMTKAKNKLDSEGDLPPTYRGTLSGLINSIEQRTETIFEEINGKRAKLFQQVSSDFETFIREIKKPYQSLTEARAAIQTNIDAIGLIKGRQAVGKTGWFPEFLKLRVGKRSVFERKPWWMPREVADFLLKPTKNKAPWYLPFKQKIVRYWESLLCQQETQLLQAQRQLDEAHAALSRAVSVNPDEEAGVAMAYAALFLTKAEAFSKAQVKNDFVLDGSETVSLFLQSYQAQSPELFRIANTFKLRRRQDVGETLMARTRKVRSSVELEDDVLRELTEISQELQEMQNTGRASPNAMLNELLTGEGFNPADYILSDNEEPQVQQTNIAAMLHEAQFDIPQALEEAKKVLLPGPSAPAKTISPKREAERANVALRDAVTTQSIPSAIKVNTNPSAEEVLINRVHQDALMRQAQIKGDGEKAVKARAEKAYEAIKSVREALYKNSTKKGHSVLDLFLDAGPNAPLKARLDKLKVAESLESMQDGVEPRNINLLTPKQQELFYLNRVSIALARYEMQMQQFGRDANADDVRLSDAQNDALALALVGLVNAMQAHLIFVKSKKNLNGNYVNIDKAHQQYLIETLKTYQRILAHHQVSELWCYENFDRANPAIHAQQMGLALSVDESNADLLPAPLQKPIAELPHARLSLAAAQGLRQEGGSY